MFCPKCGSILMPKKKGEKKVLACSCGYSSETASIASLSDKKQVKDERDSGVVQNTDFEAYPKTKATCPKCKNNEAHYWLVQTRAGDEPETKFMKCTKCKHTWRDYS